MAEFTLSDLEKRVAERANASAEDSYTRTLIEKGVEYCAKKVNEEAFETGIAALRESKERVVSEAADLLYHLVVLLKTREIRLAEVEAELNRRTMQGGHAEKASRPRKT